MIKALYKFRYKYYDRSILIGLYNPFKESSKVRILNTKYVFIIQFYGLYFSIVKII